MGCGTHHFLPKLSIVHWLAGKSWQSYHRLSVTYGNSAAFGQAFVTPFTQKSFGTPLLLRRTLKKRRDISTMVYLFPNKYRQMRISCWADSPIKDVNSNQILLVE